MLITVIHAIQIKMLELTNTPH